MVLNPIIDSVISIVFLITVLKTIYSKCFADNEEKKDDDIKEKKIQTNASLHNLNSYYHEDKIKDEEYILTPIKRSYECFQCYRKLYGTYKKNYFAFDNEYCESCWNKVRSKVINNRF